jgi:amino acid permease
MAQMVSLGWALGILSVVVFASTAIYSGVLLSRVRAMYPTATGYSDLAHRLGGLHFGVFTNCCILFNWSFLLPYYLMACANGLVIAMYDTDACYWQWALL